MRKLSSSVRPLSCICNDYFFDYNPPNEPSINKQFQENPAYRFWGSNHKILFWFKEYQVLFFFAFDNFINKQMNQVKQKTPQKLHPLQYSPALAKRRVGPARYLSQHYQRYQTEANQIHSDIFPKQLGVQRHHSVSERDNKKEYMMIRQYELRRDYDRQRLRLKSSDLSLPLKKKSHFDLQTFQNKATNRPIFSQNINNLKVKDLQCNLLHLLRIFENLLKKQDTKAIIDSIKHYILEEQSDLNELELCLQNQKDRLIVKYIIFHERVLLILLVESIVNKRYRFNQQNFIQLFREIINFYSLIYFQLTQTTIQKMIEKHQFKLITPHLPKNNKIDIIQVKENLNKKMSQLSRQFGELHEFISKENCHLKSHPSNLLYYNLLQFYAGRLTAGEWTGWGIEFLQTCPSPYVHHMTTHKYTLLLDLDETLVHYRTTSSNRGEFLLRPNLFSFLSQLQPHFQLGVFTCALQSYADLILEHMPMISIKLYRQHAVKVGKELVKDLSRVGRDLSRIILVDNLSKNFQLQQQNGIHIRSWYGESNDNVLIDLGKELQKLAKKGPSDLRKSNHQRSFL